MPASSAHFGKVELANVFAEVGLGGLAKAVDGEAAALAQGDLVGVHREDLLLREAVLELEGDAIWMILRLMRFSGVRKKPRASCMVSVEPPSLSGAVVKSRDKGAEEAEVVHAAVLEEAAVFNGSDGLHKVLRKFVVGDQAALGAVASSERPVISCGSSSYALSAWPSSA